MYVARYAGHIPRPPVTVVNNVTNINIINNPVVVNKYTNIVKSTNITNVTNVNNTVVNIKNVNKTVNNTTNNTVVNKAVQERFSNLKPVAAEQKEVFIRNTRQIQDTAKRASRWKRSSWPRAADQGDRRADDAEAGTAEPQESPVRKRAWMPAQISRLRRPSVKSTLPGKPAPSDKPPMTVGDKPPVNRPSSRR